MSSLFRKEALESRGQKFTNPIRVDGLPSVKFAFGFFGLLFAGLITFGLLVDYQRKVDVNGYLAPEGGAITLSPETSGVLNILVSNGAYVTAGHPVATLQAEKTNSTGASLQELEIASLERRLEFLAHRAQLINNDLAAIGPDLESDIARLTEQLRIANERLILSQAELGLLSDILVTSDTLLTQGLTTVSSHSQAKQAKLVSDQKVLNAMNQINALKSDITRRHTDAKEQTRRLQSSHYALGDEKEVIEAQISLIRSNQEIAIEAPIDGVLSYVQAQNHERASAGQPLFQIKREGAEHVGVLLAPSWAIGFLEVGDVVRVRYRAFPYQEYGVFNGRVTHFDAAAQAPAELDAPLQVTESVFRVFVEIDQVPISKGGEPLRLSQGMIFEASVVIDERPVIWWLLDPVV